MIQLHELHIENFMCFGTGTKINLREQGLVCLMGNNTDTSSADSNGAGKSAILEAIYFVLYNKTIRGMLLDEVVRNGVDEGCFVELTFRNDAGSMFRVRRNRGRNKNKDALYVFQILHSGEELPIEGENKKETQQKLESIVGMSSRLFSQIILFGKGGMTRFSQLGDGEKKQLIEEVLDVSTYEKAIELTRKKMNSMIKEKGLIDRDLEATNEHLETATHRLQDLELMKSEWVERRSRERKQLESEIDQLQRQIEENKGIDREDPSVFECRLRELDTKIEDIQAELSEVARKSKKLQDRSLQKQEELLKQQAEQDGLLTFLQKEHARIDSLIFDGRCPTCGQKTDASVFEGVEEMPRRIIVAKMALGKTQEALSNLSSAKKKLLDELAQKDKAFKAELADFYKEQREINTEVHALRSTPDPKDVLLVSQTRYKKLLEEGENYPHQSKIDEASGKVEEIQEKRLVLTSRIDKLTIHISEHKVLIDVFTSIRSFIFESLLGEFNSKLQDYCKIFTGGQLSASVKPTSETARGKTTEKVSVEIYNSFGGETYASCSRGERERIDFPIALALQDIAAHRGVGVGVCFFDELFEGIDEIGSRNMIELLNVASRREHTSSILVITHNDSLKSFFPTSWRVTKKKGVAELDSNFT